VTHVATHSVGKGVRGMRNFGTCLLKDKNPLTQAKGLLGKKETWEEEQGGMGHLIPFPGAPHKSLPKGTRDKALSRSVNPLPSLSCLSQPLAALYFWICQNLLAPLSACLGTGSSCKPRVALPSTPLPSAWPLARDACAQQYAPVVAEELFPGQSSEQGAVKDTNQMYSLSVPLPCDTSHLPAALQQPETLLGMAFLSSGFKGFLMPGSEFSGTQQAAASNSTWAGFTGPQVLWVLQCPGTGAR